jgi:gliding motility-associated-like protein
MKYIQSVLNFISFCVPIFVLTGQNITVDDTKTAADLVTILTQSSTCISVSSQTVKGDNFTAGKNSYGHFNAAGSSFPFSEGIILSTGNATSSIGPFVAGEKGEGKFTWLGDPELNQILGINSLNATVLEFDFIPQTNYISFNYIFASNEYQFYFPCEYSDGFAFLIKENIPGAVYQNLAIIPETTTPVSSQNIHPKINDIVLNGTKYPGCPALNENYFNGFNPASSPINYSGQTVVMKAQTQLVAGKNYHIKLVIADSRDPDRNSAVFIESGSFTPKIDFGPDRLLATNNPICFGDTFLLDTKSPSTYTYEWFKDGSTTPIPGETNPTYNTVDSGIYKVEADIGTGCITQGEIKIEFALPLILNPSPLGKCDENGTGTANFDLTKVETEIKSNNSTITKVDFYETQTGTILSDPIINRNTFVKTLPTDQIIFIEATNVYGCTSRSTVDLTTLPSNYILATGIPPKINDFSGNNNSVELIPPTSGGPFEYSFDGINFQVSNLFSGLTTGNYTAYIRDIVTCDFSIFDLTILDYPRFFTPNEDGINDIWEIKNLDLFPKAIVSIFDRYGKLLTQINTLKNAWNGKYNDLKMPSDDYWFSINFGDGKIVKGHFTLKR